MNINSRLEKLERLAPDNADESETVRLDLGPGWSMEIPAKDAPQLFQNIIKIYGQSDVAGLSE
jgi:hypothetical protein